MRVTNTTDQILHLHSFDSDSVTIPPKARDVKVADKFSWMIPDGIVIVEKPVTIVTEPDPEPALDLIVKPNKSK